MGTPNQLISHDALNSHDERAVIRVCGVGGGGGNAVTRMIEEGLQDVEFVAINTDAQALKKSPAGVRLQIGSEITHGLGSGAKPDVGLKAAKADEAQIAEVVNGADMVFITAGLGGGTGTGAAPVVAEIARQSGALTVGIVTLPFSFEGKERAANAQTGLTKLSEHVDALIVVPNDNVARLCQNNIPLKQAFRQADEVLHNGVRAISELITITGIVNLDFADVRTIMEQGGRALMGIGAAEGEGRAQRAAQEAIICPMLEQSTIHGATGVIVNVKGGPDLNMNEVAEAVELIQDTAEPDANIIFGVVIEESDRPQVQVTVIATGFRPAGEAIRETPAEAIEPATIEFPKPVVESKPVAKRIEPAEPVVTYLFPEEEPAPKPAPRMIDDDEFSIPAYMRKRKTS